MGDGAGDGENRRRGSTWTFLRGLNTSVEGNAQAFGFSITITVTYGVVNSSSSTGPSLGELFVFAFSAVAAFSLLNLVLAWLLRDRSLRKQPKRVVLVATATDFLAVGAGLAAVVGARQILAGWPLWALAPFCAAAVYVLVQALELMGGQEQEDEQDDG